MSLLAVERYLTEQKRVFQSKGKTLNVAYLWSDRSGKEFSCTPFLQGLGAISVKLGIIIIWGFSVPQHGKFLHDAEGRVIKCAYINGVHNQTVTFGEHDDVDKYATEVQRFMVDHFADARFKMRRSFHTISKNDVTHINTPYVTLAGIKSYFCFRTTGNANEIAHRHLTCTCFACRDLDWENCQYKYIVGTWKTHTFRRKNQNNRQQQQAQDLVNVNHVLPIIVPPVLPRSFNNNSMINNDLDRNVSVIDEATGEIDIIVTCCVCSESTDEGDLVECSDCQEMLHRGCMRQQIEGIDGLWVCDQCVARSGRVENWVETVLSQD